MPLGYKDYLELIILRKSGHRRSSEKRVKVTLLQWGVVRDVHIYKEDFHLQVGRPVCAENLSHQRLTDGDLPTLFCGRLKVIFQL